MLLLICWSIFLTCTKKVKRKILKILIYVVIVAIEHHIVYIVTIMNVEIIMYIFNKIL